MINDTFKKKTFQLKKNMYKKEHDHTHMEIK